MMRIEVIGDATLYLADCRDVFGRLGVADLLMTDPPYGIGESGGASRTRGRKRANHERLDWDDETPGFDVFADMFRLSRDQAIFGGNYFTDRGLPPRMGWLYWDKAMGGDFSDGELVFTSRQAALRAIRIPQNSVDKVHPTQKPVPVMKAVLSYFPETRSVLDPFMGSGSSGIAAIETGCTFVGIEREESYFDHACRRIEAAARQQALFANLPIQGAR